MAYTKHEWVTGEIITATNLNHMEDGIASKLDASAVVNSQEADTPGTALDAMQGNPDVPGSLAAQIKEAGESSKAIVLTQAQYDALTDEEKDSDNVYYISDAPFESSNVVPLTRAEYDALSDATKMDGRFYYITDEAEVAKSLVVQNNVNSTETVPSSAVVYNLTEKNEPSAWSSNIDMNDLKTAGVYALSTGISNAPVDNHPWSPVIVVKAVDTVRQILMLSDGTVYERVYQSSAWGNWAVVSNRTTIYHTTVSITTGANGGANLYTKTDSFGAIFTFQNTLAAFPLGIQKNLHCELYTWNSSLYVVVKDIDGTVYANQTLNLHIITYH